MLAAASVLYALAGRIPVVPVPGQLGPDFWPRLALLGLAAASAARLAERWRAGSGATGARLGTAEAAAAPHHVAGEADDTPPPYDRRTLTCAVLLLLGYAWAAPVAGFPLATALFLAGFMWLAGLHRPLPVALLGAGITVVLLYLFVKVVYLPLPRGQWAFHDATLAVYRALGIM
jgi:hypothetical protein